MIIGLLSLTLVFLALRMIHRNPLSLTAPNPHLLARLLTHQSGLNALEFADPSQYNACNEIVNVLRLTPTHISSTPFPTLLRQHLPKQFVDEIYGPYNAVCLFIKLMKYFKAERLRRSERSNFGKGIALLKLCCQGNGAGDGPTSVILSFLKP